MEIPKMYKTTVTAYVTVLEEQVIWLPAESEEEFKRLAEIEFQTRVDREYGYCDFDELHFGEIKDLGRLPF